MKLLGLVAASVLSACSLFTHEPPGPPRRTQMGLEIAQATLHNGMQVVFVKDPSARDVQVTVRYGFGDVDDPVGHEGTAHLVEHMMFETPVGDTSVFDRLGAIATAFNGFTSHDTTTYVERGAPDQLDAMLQIEMTRLARPCATWTEVSFQRERAAVVNEQRQNETERNLISLLERVIYPADHPYTRVGKSTEGGLATLTLPSLR